MKSLWSEYLELDKYSKLNHDISTDVLVVGGGMAGILCAYELQNKGADVVLVEADEVCSGITKNTTAKITAQHGLIYHKIIKKYSVSKAQMYYDANEKACLKYEKLCTDIQCDYEAKDSYVYTMCDDGEIEDELKALEQIGHPKKYTEDLGIPIKTKGAVRFSNQAQFNPGKFITKLAGTLSIYEHTRVLKLEGTKAICDEGIVTAQSVIIATHFPFINKHGNYYLKLYQHRSYVIALKDAQDVHGMYVDKDKKGLSFRNYKDTLILGGGAHRTGKKGGGFTEIRETANVLFPDAHEIASWATQDCMSLDGMPYIGKYSPNMDGVYVVTGFNKWGMTSSMVAAMVLADMILGKKSEFQQLYSPSRSWFHWQLAINMGETLGHYVLPISKRCSHLGCALMWNKEEHTWDCPCHGSRYEEDGTLIDNPAVKNSKL